MRLTKFHARRRGTRATNTTPCVNSLLPRSRFLDRGFRDACFAARSPWFRRVRTASAKSGSVDAFRAHTRRLRFRRALQLTPSRALLNATRTTFSTFWRCSTTPAKTFRHVGGFHASHGNRNPRGADLANALLLLHRPTTTITDPVPRTALVLIARKREKAHVLVLASLGETSFRRNETLHFLEHVEHVGANQIFHGQTSIDPRVAGPKSESMLSKSAPVRGLPFGPIS